MDLKLKKKKVRMTGPDKQAEEDRISRLSDELIHQILSYVDMTSAVQTSVLSKRWKFIWTTLPFLNFRYDQRTNAYGLFSHVLSERNHLSHVSKMKVRLLRESLYEKLIPYAISHHVQYLNVHLLPEHEPYKLSNFSSGSIRKLKLKMKLEDIVFESECWVLPALTTLHLKRIYDYWYRHYDDDNNNLPVPCLTCLPALTSLCLTDWDLRESTLLFSLPNLTSLRLSMCKLPNKIWNFPALKSLALCDVVFPRNIQDIFAALVCLQNLTLCFYIVPIQSFHMTCHQLVNLEIKTRYNIYYNDALKPSITVFASELSSFTSVGIFGITFVESYKLDRVHMKLRGWNSHITLPWEKLKECYRHFLNLLCRVSSAKILHLDLEIIEALSSISDFLIRFGTPFRELKYLILPHGCKETSMSSTLRLYLLGGSPTATIVTTLPQNTIPHVEAHCVTAQNVVIEEPLAIPTKVLVDSENLHKIVCIDTVDMGMQEEHMVQNSSGKADRVKHIDAPVEGTDNDQVSSSRKNSDFGLWRGHKVGSEFLCLLDYIMNRYPETFEHFATKNKMFCTMKLNMLCTAVNDFTKISMTEVDTEMIAEYRDVFAGLQNFGFNVSWLVCRLNFVELLRFSQPLLPELRAVECHIDDAKSKLQDLQICIDDTKSKLQNLHILRTEKMQEIQKAFGTMGTNLLVGYIGDDLFSGP